MMRLHDTRTHMYVCIMHVQGVMMPSPDFSMPYNVISISSTVIAIAFASILKLGTKVLIPDDP